MRGHAARFVVRRGVKQAAANCLHRTGARRGLAVLRRRAAGGPRVLIIAYHRVVPEFDEMRDRVIPALVTSVPTFEKQLETIAKSYRMASLGEALAVLAGRATTERDLCVVTFDDGYADFYDHALPVLQRLGIPAVLYVPTGFVGGTVPLLHDRLYWLLRRVERHQLPSSVFRTPAGVHAGLDDALRSDPVTAVNRLLERWSWAACVQIAQAIERTLGEDPAAALGDSPPLSWDEVRAAQAAGVEIGGHTIDHSCLHNESLSDVIRQTRASRDRLASELGSAPSSFAYPNGWYSQQVISTLRNVGYSSAVTTEDRLNRVAGDPFVLKRKIVWEFTTRGLRGFSPAVAACAFTAVGARSRQTGDRSNAMRDEYS